MKLKAGDIVDIIAPSSPPQNNQWKKGISILEDWGLKPRMAGGTVSPWLFHSNSNKKRSAFLNQAFFNKESKAVWMLRGGYGLQKLMPSFIKKDSHKSQKKLFIGYSDGTALHLYLNGRGQKTLHAPVISELPDLSKTDLLRLKKVLFGEAKQIVFNNLKVFKAGSQKKIKAPVIGGNLSLLSGSLGTPWFPELKPCFLFLEDVNEEAYQVDRMLHHLFYAGALKGVKALLFGSFHPLSGNSLKKEVLKSFSEVCSLPMILGLPCGHKPIHRPLPFNSPAELTIQGGKAGLKVFL